MDAYQDFLNFFTLHNKERLDGLSEQYFTAMTRDERARAFDYLMARVERGGSEESVFGLFRADSQRAVAPVRRLLQAEHSMQRHRSQQHGISGSWRPIIICWSFSSISSAVPTQGYARKRLTGYLHRHSRSCSSWPCKE